MLSKWQFNILFFLGVGGSILTLLGPMLGLDFNHTPGTIAGIGAIMTYIMTQRDVWIKEEHQDKPPEEKSTEVPEEPQS